MKVDATVKRETGRIAAGTAVLSVLMIAVFLVLKKFDLTVLAGALWGTAFAVLNFFLLGLAVQKAAAEMNGVTLPPPEKDEATGEEVEAPPSEQALIAKKKMQLSYSGRMLLMLLSAVLAFVLPFIHPIAGIVPLLFPRIVIMILGAAGKAQ